LSFVKTIQLKKILLTGLFLACFLSIAVRASARAGLKDSSNRAVSTASPVISDIVINILDYRGSKSKWVEMANSLIILKKGDLFSASRLQESLETLKLSKRFQKIDVDFAEEKNRITLIFWLTPFRLIKDIRIKGNFPFFEREILYVMTIYAGKVFIQEELHRQAALIEAFFRREGFSAPKVNVTACEDSKDGFFVVYVKIEKGPYYTLQRLEITGNHAFSIAKLKLKMMIWRVSFLFGSSGRFVEENLKKDIENLSRYYWKKRYPDVSINFRLEKDARKKSISVFVTINEGSMYDIEFVGNDAFWDITLRKDLILFEKGNRNDLGLRKSAKKIEQRYKMAGYSEVKVKIEEETKTGRNETIRSVRFVIDEGPRSLISSVRIKGNKAFDEGKLKKQMLIRPQGFWEKGVFVPETLEEDLNAIKALYLKEGYIDTEVKEKITLSKNQKDVSVNLEIKEGVQTIVSSVRIRGITVISEKDAFKAISLKKGEPFRKYMIQSDENALSVLVSEKGHPYVRVKGDVSFSEDMSEAEVVYAVHEGPYVTMGRSFCTGNIRTKDRILENELEIEPGDPFSLTNMVKGQRNIRNMDIFNTVRFKTIGLKEKRKKVSLFVELEEKKPYFIEGAAGYESEGEFFLNAKAGDRNMFGTNKYGWLEGEVSRIGYRCELGIIEPRLMGSRISAGFNLFSEQREELNKNFGIRTQGSSLGFTRKWSKFFATGLNFRFERRDQFSRDSKATETELYDDTDEFRPRSILVTTPSVIYDSRDSFIRPGRGTFSSFSVDISDGLSNSDDNFLRYRFDMRLYVSLLPGLTLAFLGRAGYIDPFGSTKKVPDDQLFFLGGTLDVRGFETNMLSFDANRDPAGGRTAVNGSLEARIDLEHNFELALFYDTGCISDIFDNTGDVIGSDRFRSSVGGGLRYITPIGAISLLYGIKLDPEEDESSGRLHFSVGYTF